MAGGADLYPPPASGFKFVHGSIELQEVRSNIPDAYFDLVVANDVLEHLVDTEFFMSTVFQKLRMGGRFLCSVPNGRQIRLFYHLFLRGQFPRTDSGLFDKTHLRWLCRKDVIAFAEQAGFRLEPFGAGGKLVPAFMQRTVLTEFLGLQNLFLFAKR